VELVGRPHVVLRLEVVSKSALGVRGLVELFSQTCFIGCFTQCVFAGGGRPKNAARISAVPRSRAGVIWTAFFLCSVEHYNRMCTGITCI
jgi:hypothetical protein